MSASTVSAEVRDVFFRRYMMDPDNKTCIDCPLKNPTWASATFGVLLCMDCAAKHRRMGTHITFVRSTQLDEWTLAQLKTMELGGNGALNNYLRHHGGLKLAGSEATAEKYTSRAALKYKSQLQAAVAAALQSLQLQEPTIPAPSPPQPEPVVQPAPQVSAPPIAAPNPTTTDDTNFDSSAPQIKLSGARRAPAKKPVVAVKKVTSDAFKQAESSAASAPAVVAAAPAPQPTSIAALPSVTKPLTNQPAPLQPAPLTQQSFFDHTKPAPQKPVGSDFFSKWTAVQSTPMPTATPSSAAPPVQQQQQQQQQSSLNRYQPPPQATSPSSDLSSKFASTSISNEGYGMTRSGSGSGSGGPSETLLDLKTKASTTAGLVADVATNWIQTLATRSTASNAGTWK